MKMILHNKNCYKKIIAILLSLVTILTCFCGCTVFNKKQKLSIVTTIFPEYDWVMEILGEKSVDFDVTMLLDTGMDLHNYYPTADDVIKLSTCDLFIYVGGESDEWVADALKSTQNENMITINLIETLGNAAKKETAIEGASDKGEDSEYDEHVWLSLKNADIFVNTIKDAIVKIDSANEAVYSENSKNYCDALQQLDKQYKQAVAISAHPVMICADRFPFRYLAEDYGIKYYAAFSGCSTEISASFETISFLAQKVRENNLDTVFILENSKQDIAETVVNTSGKDNVKILNLDSMQSVTDKEVKAGVSYIGIMGKNLEYLKQSLL